MSSPERKIVLDTETTGLDPKTGHRVIEIGCVELINRELTGNNYHQYINPQREVDAEAMEVHGITNEFLEDKPLFSDIAADFVEYIRGAELVIHNAPFDVGFLNSELQLAGVEEKIEDICTVTDTLVMAQRKHRGRNNLDALCKRYEIDNSHRALHGALLDAEILSDVYLAMTGGQSSIEFTTENNDTEERRRHPSRERLDGDVFLQGASSEESDQHDLYLKDIEQVDAATPIVPLGIHTDNSLIDSLLKINDYVSRAKELGYTTLAISDFNNTYGAIDFYMAARKAGIKPIIGVDATVQRNDGKPFQMRLYAANNQGLVHIYEMLTAAQKRMTAGETKEPIIEFSQLNEKSDGIIACAGIDSELNPAFAGIDVGHYAAQYAEIFGDRFYLEVSRSGKQGEEEFNKIAVQISEKHHVPVVATNPARFSAKEDFDAHEVRVAIATKFTLDDERRPRNTTRHQYLMSPKEMSDVYKDIPGALQNTYELAKRCNVSISLGAPALPAYPVETESEGAVILQGLANLKLTQKELQNRAEADYLRHKAYAGLEKRFVKLGINDDDKKQAYRDRLETELKVINDMGFDGYFLIVSDFCEWSHENGVIVGPGRGSGAGSLVAYSLSITELDPIEYELLFERFLNPERISMPDFDIDFDDRDAVIAYVNERYGDGRVAQITTFGTMGAKSSVQGAARALGHPAQLGLRLSKLISDDPGVKLAKELDENDELRTLYEGGGVESEILKTALPLEGVITHVGKHAGGVVIAPNDENGNPTNLTDTCFLTYDEDKPVAGAKHTTLEAANLVKFDFLGLTNLSAMKQAINDINTTRKELGEEPLDLNRLPLDDAETFQLMKAARTQAVFQLESNGMRELIKNLQPESFEDMIALVALYRPGPLQSGMVDDFVECKHGRQEIKSLHPALDEILKPTYGVILYQEQVMQAAQKVAGYTLGGADILRRAMGKKKPEEMAKQRDVFVKGAVERGTSEEKANSLFDLIDKFSGYGFNKSHSAAYADIAYRNAYLKAHYPSQYMAGYMTSIMDSQKAAEKITSYIADLKTVDVAVVKPNINTSGIGFRPTAGDEITYGFAALKGIGTPVAQRIVDEREKHGKFIDYFDACTRLTSSKVTLKQIETLINAGAFDNFNGHRAEFIANLSQFDKKRSKKQKSMFGDEHVMEHCPEWDLGVLLAKEKSALGIYLTGHPFEEHAERFKKILTPIANIEKPGFSKIGGLITDLRKTRTRRDGRSMAIFKLSDHSGGSISCVAFPDTFESCREAIAKDEQVLIKGRIQEDQNGATLQMVADEIATVESVIQKQEVSESDNENASQAIEDDNAVIADEENPRPIGDDGPEEAPPATEVPIQNQETTYESQHLVFRINLPEEMKDVTDANKELRRRIFDSIKQHSTDGQCDIYVSYGGEPGVYLKDWKVSADTSVMQALSESIEQIDCRITTGFNDQAIDKLNKKKSIDNSASEISGSDVNTYRGSVQNDPQLTKIDSCRRLGS